MDKKDFDKEVRNNINRIIHKKNLKQKDIAKNIGLKPSSLCRYLSETECRCLSLYHIIKFCQTTRTDLKELLPYETPKFYL